MRLIVLSILALLLPATANAAWYRAESDNFVVFAEFSGSHLSEYVLELERFDRLLRHFSSLPYREPNAKLRIFVLRDADDVGEYMDDDRGFVGVYLADPRGPYVLTPRRSVGRGRYRLTSQNIVFHEYAHHFMLQNFPTNYPSWYVEGLAEFYSTTRLRNDDRVEVGHPARQRILWLNYFNWLRHEDMLSNESPDTGMTYAQGWLLVHYASFNPTVRASLNAYLQSVAQGTNPRQAYRDTLGELEPNLDDQLMEYGFRRTFPIVRSEIPVVVPDAVNIRRLSNEEADVALLYARESHQLYDHALEAVRDYPENPQAHVEYAISLIARNEAQAAIEAADRALAIEPDHVEANIYRGIATMTAVLGSTADIVEAERDAPETMSIRDILQRLRDMAIWEPDEAMIADPRWQEARTYLLRANRADPYNALALLNYYISYPDRGSRPENAMAALEQAFNLVPQAAHTRVLLGSEYIQDGRFEEALGMLEPVASDPHVSRGMLVATLYTELAQREVGFDQVDAVLDEVAADIERTRSEREQAESVIDTVQEAESAEGDTADDEPDSDEDVIDAEEDCEPDPGLDEGG